MSETEPPPPLLQAVQRKKLAYKIHNFSSFSASYQPDNILDDKPSDQSSRWSSDTNNSPQYITLQLDAPTIITSVVRQVREDPRLQPPGKPTKKK